MLENGYLNLSQVEQSDLARRIRQQLLATIAESTGDEPSRP